MDAGILMEEEKKVSNNVFQGYFGRSGFESLIRSKVKAKKLARVEFGADSTCT